jgi:hypothetical protein
LAITKAGNGYLRQMLIVGATAVIRYAQRNRTRRPWLVQLMGRRRRAKRLGGFRIEATPHYGSAEIRIETLRCRMLRPLTPRIAFSKRFGRVLRLSELQSSIKLLALSRLLL